MAYDNGRPCVDDLDVTLRMCARLRAGQPTDPRAIERALEAGVGALVSLEAKLGRVRRGPAADPRARTEATDLLQQRIIELRDALAELRTLSAPPGQSRIGYGFVLPRDDPNLQAHPS